MAYNFSDNIQRGILYFLKFDLEFYAQIIPLIKKDYFEYPSYGLIFESVQDFYLKYKKLPSDTIIIEYIKTKISEKENIAEYEDDLLKINNIDTSIIDNKDFILDRIEDFARKSAMVAAIKKSVSLLKDNNIDGIETLVKEALLVTRNVEVGQNYFDDVDERILRLFSKDNEYKIATPFETFNVALEGGLSRKELGMVVACAGIGKSTYLVNQGATSLLNGLDVLYISLEMREDLVSQRFDTVLTLLNNKKLKEPGTQLKLRERLKIVKDKIGDAQLIVKEFPTGQCNVNQLRALLFQLKLHKNFTPDLILVDYLELLRPNRMIESEYQAQQRIAEELRGLAMETDTLIITATQANRQGRRVQVITDSELGDSFGKIRPCDWAISLNQSAEEYDKGSMRAYVMKSRCGKQNFLVNVSIDYNTLRMEENLCTSGVSDA